MTGYTEITMLGPRSPLCVKQDENGSWLGANGERLTSADAAHISFREVTTEQLAGELARKYHWSSVSADKLGNPLTVFLSYAREDKQVVRQLFKRLASSRVDPWFDEEMLLPGQPWKDIIARKIDEVDMVIVCLSSRSVTKEGFVNAEIKRVLQRADMQPEGSIFVVPLRLEKCRLPSRLADYHCADYFQPDGYKRLTDAMAARAYFLQRSLPLFERT